ncbi:hypothetical protein Afil01_51350 [Actinorhabdospora filicis]|uniref:Uncharacterized protein n=1 Tax=Actinorhabdospora filicis TaxID=1785913 RepID=A0A9W6SQ65_9ACTN|nr:DUF2306 domain-containing protein [Actinorhabdospora filicis]GLZ80328.1 hypothetical protein Afil01_51350 [Actinorhabdospora filicis]
MTLSKRWWRRPWVAPMFVVMVAFLAFSLPPYLMGGSRLPLREGFAAHKILLDVHIGFGMIALIACGFQVWPWFRGKYPKAHKIMGRVYVLGGVLPAGLMALVVSVTALTGPVGRIGNVMLSLLWLFMTFRGYKSARRRQFGDHRRWMIRSFALCTSIVLNRVWIILLLIGLQPWLDTHYGGSMDALIGDAAQASIWLSWTVNLALAEWWLDKGKGKAREKRGAVRETVGAAN